MEHFVNGVIWVVAIVCATIIVLQVLDMWEAAAKQRWYDSRGDNK